MSVHTFIIRLLQPLLHHISLNRFVFHLRCVSEIIFFYYKYFLTEVYSNKTCIYFYFFIILEMRDRIIFYLKRSAMKQPKLQKAKKWYALERWKTCAEQAFLFKGDTSNEDSVKLLSITVLSPGAEIFHTRVSL